jgi:small subunit ribosomal protein S6
MRHYETTYILRPNLGEDQFTEIIDRTNDIVADFNGAVITVDRWGSRKLAYEISKETQGYYVYMNFASEGGAVAEIERIFRIDDRVLRYLTVKLSDKDVDPAALQEEAAKAAQAQVAEADEEQQSAENSDTEPSTNE